jgi:hypothetical protein
LCPQFKNFFDGIKIDNKNIEFQIKKNIMYEYEKQQFVSDYFKDKFGANVRVVNLVDEMQTVDKMDFF